MNSLSYLSRQFDVLAASDAQQRQQNNQNRLPRVQTWSAKSLLFPQTAGLYPTKPALKRVVTSPAQFVGSSSLPATSRIPSASQVSQPPTPPKSKSPAMIPPRTSPSPTPSSSTTRSFTSTLRSIFRRMFFVRILIVICDALYAGWQTLTTTTPVPPSSPQRKRRARKISMQISITSNEDSTTSSSSSSSDLESHSNPPIPLSSVPSRLHVLGRYHTDTEVAATDTTTTTTTSPYAAAYLHPPLSQSSSPNRRSRQTPPLSPSQLAPEPSLTPPPRNLPSSRSSTPTSRKSSIHMPKTLVLDLDETLIHSTSRPIPAYSHSSFFGNFGGGLFSRNRNRNRTAGHTVEVILGGKRTVYHVYKRPFVDFFLRTVSGWYTLVIFTASMQEYADPVIDWLDAGRGILARRLFRDSCTQLPNGSYTKDLAIIEPDLARVCLLDNSPISYRQNEDNGIPIEGWTHDPSDEALLDLLPVLDSLRFTSDVRKVLGIRGFT